MEDGEGPADAAAPQAEKKHQCKYVYTRADQAAWKVNNTEIDGLHKPGTQRHKPLPVFPHPVGSRCRSSCKIVGSSRVNSHYDDYCAAHSLGTKACNIKCRWLAGVNEKQEQKRKGPGGPLVTRRHRCRNCAESGSFYCKRHDPTGERLEELKRSPSNEGMLWRMYHDAMTRPVASVSAPAIVPSAPPQPGIVPSYEVPVFNPPPIVQWLNTHQ